MMRPLQGSQNVREVFAGSRLEFLSSSQTIREPSHSSGGMREQGLPVSSSRAAMGALWCSGAGDAKWARPLPAVSGQRPSHRSMGSVGCGSHFAGEHAAARLHQQMSMSASLGRMCALVQTMLSGSPHSAHW